MYIYIYGQCVLCYEKVHRPFKSTSGLYYIRGKTNETNVNFLILRMTDSAVKLFPGEGTVVVLNIKLESN